MGEDNDNKWLFHGYDVIHCALSLLYELVKLPTPEQHTTKLLHT